jgi:hypothetical protein
MYAGLAGMDFIRSLVQSGTDVTTVALGYCASAAVRSVTVCSREHADTRFTFTQVDIFLAGSRRLMGKNSYILIHQLSVDIGGTYSTLKVEVRQVPERTTQPSTDKTQTLDR